MRSVIFAAALLALGACQPGATTSTSSATTDANATREATSTVAPDAPYIVAALADTHRTTAEKARDAARHPAEMLALAEIAPGQKVIELLPGEGYFTRLFADAVGSNGRVYAVNRTPASQYEHPVLTNVANVTNVGADYDKFTAPEPVDVVFTAQNFFRKNYGMPLFDPEQSGNTGFNAPVRYISEHIPAAATFLTSLRISF